MSKMNADSTKVKSQSETKEIKNPYMGKAMLTSGCIKEEIK